MSGISDKVWDPIARYYERGAEVERNRAAKRQVDTIKTNTYYRGLYGGDIPGGLTSISNATIGYCFKARTCEFYTNSTNKPDRRISAALTSMLDYQKMEQWHILSGK